MTLRFSFLLFIAALLMPGAISAQMHNNIWYFGHGAGIDFNVSPPAPLLDGAMYSLEGSAAVCDPVNGTLLFYTNGDTVWNRNHEVMLNGTGLHGSWSTLQSAQVIAAPGSCTGFYIFTAAKFEGDDYLNIGIEYSFVDMNLDGGLGGVTTKNVPLLKPGTERQTAVPHANGQDVWHITPRYGTNEIHATRITAAGLSAPVVSAVGPASSQGYRTMTGSLHASPDGKHLAMMTDNGLHLYDFDAATGIVSQPIFISNAYAYGVCFSPDNSKLYMMGITGATELVQYDISSGAQAEIAASATVLHREPLWEMGVLQLGPDGRIYWAYPKRSVMGVITDPDAAGTACGYIADGFDLGGKLAGYGMPTLAVRPTAGAAAPPTVSADTTICEDGSARLSASGASNYHWSPADGLSCADCPDPIASPSITTRYTVTVDEGTACSGSNSVLVTVVPPPVADAGRDTSSCPGVTVRLIGSGDGEFLWSPAEGLSCPTCRETDALVWRTTDYVLTVTNAAGCSDRDTVTATVDTTLVAQARIGRHGFGIGETVLVPVVVDDNPLGGLDIDRLEFRVSYDARILRLLGISLDSTLLEGWSRLDEKNDVKAGTYAVTLLAPPGASFGGKGGTLLNLPLRGYLGPVDTSEIVFEIVVPGLECGGIAPSPGVARIDSICGLSLRMIELYPEGYSLDGARPNPFNPTAEIAYSIGLDGMTRLEILDARGGTVTVLVDGMMEPGSHTATWDATAYPSGLYYCRLRSGAWSRTLPMMLVR